MSKVTVILAWVWLPAVSVPVAVIVFAPEDSGTFSAAKPRLDTTAGTPFTVTVALLPFTVPETMSFIMPVIVIGEEKTVMPS